jgi:hypothetical protein
MVVGIDGRGRRGPRKCRMPSPQPSVCLEALPEMCEVSYVIWV